MSPAPLVADPLAALLFPQRSNTHINTNHQPPNQFTTMPASRSQNHQRSLNSEKERTRERNVIEKTSSQSSSSSRGQIIGRSVTERKTEPQKKQFNFNDMLNDLDDVVITTQPSKNDSQKQLTSKSPPFAGRSNISQSESSSQKPKTPDGYGMRMENRSNRNNNNSSSRNNDISSSRNNDISSSRNNDISSSRNRDNSSSRNISSSRNNDNPSSRNNSNSPSTHPSRSNSTENIFDKSEKIHTRKGSIDSSDSRSQRNNPQTSRSNLTTSPAAADQLSRQRNESSDIPISDRSRPARRVPRDSDGVRTGVAGDGGRVASDGGRTAESLRVPGNSDNSVGRRPSSDATISSSGNARRGGEGRLSTPDERGGREREASSSARQRSRSRPNLGKRAIEEEAWVPDEMVIVDQSKIEPEYVKALIQTLKMDKIVSPDPDDFATYDGFQIWEEVVKKSAQLVLCDILEKQFIQKKREEEENSRKKREKNKELEEKQKGSKALTTIFFKIQQAEKLLSKDATKTRNAYCIVEYGDLDGDPKKGALREELKTPVINDSNNPVFKAHVKIPAADLMGKILVSCWDERKDEFLGCVKLNYIDIISTCAKDGYVKKWYSLGPRDDKKKDKFVGGDILFEYALDQDSVKQDDNEDLSTADGQLNKIRSKLLQTKIKYKSLYKTLLRGCLELDLLSQKGQINDRTVEIQTDESKATLAFLGQQWAVGDAFRTIAYLEIVFEKYKHYKIPYNVVMRILEEIHTRRKRNGWLGLETTTLVDLLNAMYAYSQTQVTKYREFYPKNKPTGALMTTILMMRMIFKNPVYKEAHPDLPDSFKSVFQVMLTESVISRFHKLQELYEAFDESDVDLVIESLSKFAGTLCEEIDADDKYYKDSFQKEVEIVQITAENYLKLFIKTLEENNDIITSDEAVKVASKSVFSLYSTVKSMDVKYAKLIPGLNRISMSGGFNVEMWFCPFVLKWLDNLSLRTRIWVENAVKADNFEALPTNDDDDHKHSSSVTDLFAAVHQELDFIGDLQWSNVIQNAKFFQNIAVEQYCDAVASGEIKMDSARNAGWLSTFSKTTSGGPSDISIESCVKLCNVEHAMKRLEDLKKMMQVESMTQNVRDYRKTMAFKPRKPKPAAAGSSSPAAVEDEKLSGQVKIQISYVENVKPCNKNGLANPYVIIRVPDGTVVPKDLEDEIVLTPSVLQRVSNTSADKDKGPSILNGKDCELAKSRVVYDSLNVTWDESFQCILAPVDQLEVAVYSKNLISFDEVCGTSKIDLARTTRLRRELQDHQTHDVFVNLEPQGRLLVRLTVDGEDEDVDFWFRKSEEKLGRTRDDFVRALTSKIAPNSRDIIGKALTESEAAPLPSKSYFSSLVSAVQYSTETANNISIDKKLIEREADQAIKPLTDYLNKNLETLCVALSSRMAQEVIKRIWDEILIFIEQLLVAPLYGQIDSGRRLFNPRQISVIEWTISILKNFFYADGEDLGIPLRLLESRQYRDLKSLLGEYEADIGRLKKTYELSLKGGQEKVAVLRLVRLKIERQEGLTAVDKDEAKKWFEVHLMKRAEVSKRSSQLG